MSRYTLNITFHPNHLPHISMYRQLEHIWPRIVPSNIEHPLRTLHHARVNLSIENFFLLAYWPCDKFSFRIDNRAVANINPLIYFSVKLLLHSGVTIWDIVFTHRDTTTN